MASGLPCSPVAGTLPWRDETQFHEKVRALSVSVLTRFWLTEAHVKNDSAGAGANGPVFCEELTGNGPVFREELTGTFSWAASQVASRVVNGEVFGEGANGPVFREECNGQVLGRGSSQASFVWRGR